MTPRLEIELPVCPVCSSVSKAQGFNGSAYCVGGKGQHHPQKKMILRKFREYRPKVEK